MGCVSSKNESNGLRGNVFHVENVDEAGQSLSPGQLEVTDSELVYHQRSGVGGGPPITTHWQLCFLRKYGFDSEIFSFECGRRCPTGAGIYAFRCKKAEQLFNTLQHSIQVGNQVNNTGVSSTPNDYPIPIASNGPPVPNRVLPSAAGPQPIDGSGYLNPTGPTGTGSIRSHTVRPDSVTSNGGAGGLNSPVSPLSPPPMMGNGDLIGGGINIMEWNNNKRGSLSSAMPNSTIANGYSNAQVVMELQMASQTAAITTANSAPTYINLIPTAATPSMGNSVSLSNAPTVPCTPTPFDNTYVNVLSNNTANAYMNVTCPPQTPGPHDMHTFAALMLPPPPGKISGIEDDRQHCYINVTEPSVASLPIWRGPNGSVPSTPTVVGNYAELDLPSIYKGHTAQLMGSIPNLSILKGPTRHLQENLLHRLFENISKGPASEKTALIFEDITDNGDTKKYSYSELNSLSNRMAHVLLDIITNNDLHRNSDGDFIIAIALPPSDRLVITLLAILKTGAAYLPIDPTFPGSRVEHIIREANPVIVIYDQDSDHFLETKKISIDELNEKCKNISESPLKQDECLRHLRDDLAIVLYTSGSTGVPKGVRLPHKVILNRLQWQFKIFPYSITEKTGVFKTALTFVDSVSEIWGPLINGLAILVVPKAVTADPERLVNVLDRYKIERLVLVPSLLRSLLLYLQLRKDKTALASLKTWVCSGETLSASLAKDFLNYFPENQYKLCNFYGSTEIMGDVTYHIISNDIQMVDQEKIPIGIPIDNTILYLLDADGKPVKTGDCGELFVAGLNLAAGYVAGRDPDRFIENPLAVDPQYSRLFKTGDFARIQKGTLLFEGRTDSQVKIRGHRVDLMEVERALIGIPGVDKAVVLCHRPGEPNQQLLAFVTTIHEERPFAQGEIEQKLRYKLTAYMLPQVILLQLIPLLVNGKVDRQTLLKEYENTNNTIDESTFAAEIDYSGVQTQYLEVAKVLFETVASVLKRSVRSTISLKANFYEIGGNSLNSIYTITSLNDRGYHISIGDFIAAVNLQEVLERLKPSNDKENNFNIDEPAMFTSEILHDGFKKDVICMITSSFYQKADVEQWLMPDISESDYTELIDAIWEPLVEKRLSFICRNKAGKVVGVAMNFDARDEPEVEIHSKLVIVFEYLESIEGPVRDNVLPSGKNVALHSFMMGTHETLAAKDNVAIMKFMEDEVLKLAKERKFVGIFTTNTSPLTQQLGCDVYGYKTLYDSQVNTFVLSDNTKPFEMAPDSQHSLVQWKLI